MQSLGQLPRGGPSHPEEASASGDWALAVFSASHDNLLISYAKSATSGNNSAYRCGTVVCRRLLFNTQTSERLRRAYCRTGVAGIARAYIRNRKSKLKY